MGRRLLPYLLLVGLIGLHGWSLSRFPPPFVDEAWLTSRAWGFVESGRCFGALDAGIFDYGDGYWTFLPCLSVMLQAAALRLAGAPELLASRLISLIFGLVLLAGVYGIGLKLGGRRLGWMSLFLVGVSYPFFYSAHLARPDVIAAALGYLALAVYLADREYRRGWVGGMIGLTLGLAFEIHPNSAIFGVALGALYVWDLGAGVVRSRQFYGCLAGGMLGLGVYAAMHILPYPGNFFEFNQYAFHATHAPPLFTLDVSILAESVVETFAFQAAALSLLTPVVALGVVELARRRDAPDKTLLLLSGSLLGSYALLVRLKAGYYAIFLAPMLLIIAARYLLEGLAAPWRGRWRDYLSRLAWGLTLVSLGMNLLMLGENSYAEYLASQKQIQAWVRQEDVILGPQIYWFGMTQHPYLYLEQIAYYRHFHPGSSLEDALRRYRPTLFIKDNHLRGYLEGSRQEGDTLFGYLALSPEELEDALRRHARPIAEFESRIAGKTTLYRFDWDD